MEIRDLIHGSIALTHAELPVLDSRYFQRLRQIRQLGFAEYSFPSATHNRYIHSLGAKETATQAFDTIFGGPRSRAESSPARQPLEALAPAARARFRAVVRNVYSLGNDLNAVGGRFFKRNARLNGRRVGVRGRIHQGLVLRLGLWRKGTLARGPTQANFMQFVFGKRRNSRKLKKPVLRILDT